jgi:hypothetical protein
MTMTLRQNWVTMSSGQGLSRKGYVKVKRRTSRRPSPRQMIQADPLNYDLPN